MKKLLSIVLILALVLSLGVTAFAEEEKKDSELESFLNELTEKDEVTEEDLTNLFNLLGDLISKELGIEDSTVTAKEMTWYLCDENDTRTQPV